MLGNTLSWFTEFVCLSNEIITYNQVSIHKASHRPPGQFFGHLYPFLFENFPTKFKPWVVVKSEGRPWLKSDEKLSSYA